MSILAWILLIVFIAFFVFEVVAFTFSVIKKRKEKKLKQNTNVEVNNVVGTEDDPKQHEEVQQ